MFRALAICIGLTVQITPAFAQDWQAVEAAARQLFSDMPRVEVFGSLPRACGADEMTNADMRYCTSENVIYLREQPTSHAKMAHALAHGLGHAIQVRHGIADIALREVRRRPEEEQKLRTMVTGQVACLAGVLLNAAGFAAIDLETLYGEEPFTDSHWGRNPLKVGPQVSTGLKFRANWSKIGQREGLAACTVGEIEASVLLSSVGYIGTKP